MNLGTIENYERALRIKQKCDVLCIPLPVEFKINEENKEVILLPVSDRKITTFEIPDFITMIDEWAFESCYKLQAVIIPDSVKRIGIGAFHDCTLLKQVKLPCDISIILEQTFSGCRSLEKIDIGDKVKEIQDWAFRRTKIKENMIPDTVENVSSLAFAWFWD